MPSRVLEGKVVSTAAQKTITVIVERRVKHPLYKKYIIRSKKYLAHDENGSATVGDIVRVSECAPISKRKCWTYVETVTPARIAA